LTKNSNFENKEMKIRLNQNECSLCKEQVYDINKMWNEIPSIRIAAETTLSLICSTPFTFTIAKLGLVSNKDTEKIIIRHWIPWQKGVYINCKKWGVCPYYFVKPEGQNDHQVPVIPDFNLGYITVYTTDDHRVKFKWYWSHDMQVDKEEKKMLWIETENAPNPDGTLKSPLSSLLSQFRTILILQKSLETASAQCANPTHVLEHHPPGGSAQNDNLTQLVANFGEKAAGLSKQRQELARASELRVRTAELIKQTHQAHERNSGMAFNRKRIMFTDLDEEAMARMDSGWDTRVIPLAQDWKYTQTARPTVVAELEKHMTAFNTDASAIMDFAREMIQPMGSARTQNVRGGERFINERVEGQKNMLRGHTHTALIIAYRRQFEVAFNEAKAWVTNRQGGDPQKIANMCPDLDVQVEMACTPIFTYEDVKQMWIDGIMSKETFAHHAFRMKSLPHDQIHVTTLPDKLPKDQVIPIIQPKKKKTE
jgi:hypothetical protein